MSDAGIGLAEAITEVKARRPETRELDQLVHTATEAELAADWRAWLAIQRLGWTRRIYLIARRIRYGIPTEELEEISSSELNDLFVDISPEGLTGGILMSESQRRAAFVGTRVVGLQAALADGRGPKFPSVLHRLRAASQKADAAIAVADPRTRATGGALDCDHLPSEEHRDHQNSAPPTAPAGSARPLSSPSPPDANAAEPRAAIRAALKSGERPGKVIGWKRFQSNLMRECGASEGQRGFSVRQIQRIVKDELNQL